MSGQTNRKESKKKTTKQKINIEWQQNTSQE